MVSVAAHTAIIAAALYATAQARPTASRTGSPLPRIYFPQPLQPTRTAQSPGRPPRTDHGRPSLPAIPRKLVFVDPVDVRLPAVDVTRLTTRPGDFPSGVRGDSGVRGSDANGGGTPTNAFSAEQVEKQVALAPGSAPPRYPETLRSAGVEGRVVASFVVDETGRAEEASVRFVRSDNPLFEDAVRGALRRMRFIPAEVAGRKVRQLVQMPFVFTISR